MRSGAKLCTSDLNDYRPVGVNGEPVYLSYRRLAATIRSKLGAEYAHFLARPEIDSEGNTIAWHAHHDAEVRRWVDLDDAEQSRLYPKVVALTDKLSDLLVDLQLSEGQSRAQQSLADRMEAVFTVPHESHLYFVGDKPVQALWAFSGDGDNIDIRNLALPPRIDEGEPVAVEIAKVPVEKRRSFWWWLIPLLLLVLLAAWLLRSCASLDSLPEAAIDEKADVSVDRTQTEEHAIDENVDVHINRNVDTVIDRDSTSDRDSSTDIGLSGEVDDTTSVDDAAGDLDESRTLQDEATSDANSQTPGVENSDDDMAEESTSDQDGSEPSAAATEPTKPDLGGDGAALEIPNQSDDSDDLTFVEGEWRSKSGLVDKQTKRPLEQRYKFDEDGQGEVVVKRADGVECRAKVRTEKTPGGIQFIEEGNITCPDGKTYEPSTTECSRSASGTAICRGKNLDGSVYEVEITR